MEKEPNGNFVAFTDAQLITATSSVAAAVSELRKQTLDEDITDREAHVVMLLGTRSALARNGVQLEPMTATRFTAHLQAQFAISDTAAENDTKRLKGIGIIECVPEP